MTIEEMARNARRASVQLAALPLEQRNQALAVIADALEDRTAEILAANAADLEESERNALDPPLLKRLKFDGKKIAGVIDGLRNLIRLPDPLDRVLSATELDKGLELYRVTCPIGVIGVIFESRPDALVQISSLCLKSGNAVLLKGGSEARRTNRVLADTICKATDQAGMPKGWLHLLETRADVAEMLQYDNLIDLVIPRGSNALVKAIKERTRIPVLGHTDGICHVYIDRAADPDMAVRISVDSKCQYVAVCNAAETLLIHRDAASSLLPRVAEALLAEGVEIVGCPETVRILGVPAATEDDWRTEYLDLKISVRVVRDIDEAIDHINTYGSGHTDAIVTNDEEAARRFLDLVDSADVFWNCSTRFSDGYRYGLGAEVGISTNKIHARGPVGLDGLVIYKWRLKGNGHIVADYAAGKRRFTHRPLPLSDS